MLRFGQEEPTDDGGITADVTQGLTKGVDDILVTFNKALQNMLDTANKTLKPGISATPTGSGAGSDTGRTIPGADASQSDFMTKYSGYFTVAGLGIGVLMLFKKGKK